MPSVSPVLGNDASALIFPSSEVTTSLDDLFTTHGEETSDNADPTDSLPAIPFDDSISPFTDCPDLDNNICVPGDANDDGAIDFLDFLLLRQHYGSENATSGQGDFNGDARVDFEDLLILAVHFHLSN